MLVVLVAAAYAPAFDAGFIWDDDDYVTRNLTLRTLDGLRRIWLEPGAVPQYYPLVHTGFWLEHHLWGPRPRGYHAVNLALHAMNAVLLWLVLRRLAVPGAWLAAAVFAVHPVHVESVVWIAERKNVLSGFFYLCALLAYLRFCRLGGWSRDAAPGKTGPAWDEHGKRNKIPPVPSRGGFLRPRIEGRAAYALALALFACGLLSKTVTGSLPVVILLLLWWKRGRLDVRVVAELIPFFVLAAALGGVTIWMEEHRVGAVGSDWAFSIVDRCLIAGRALWFYTGKLVWPVQLTFVYPRWVIDSRAWWQYSFPLAAIAAVWGLYAMRARLGRGPLVAVLCFVATLVPALGFINVFPMRYTFVADHYQYLASIGVIVLGVGVCGSLWPRWMPSGWTAAGAGALLLMLGLLTWRQAQVYHDIEALWRDTLAKNPRCWMAHNNLGLYLQEQGRLDEAMARYDAALAIKADDASAHGNLANALAVRGRTREAIEHYDMALSIDPDYAEAHSNLGNALATTGQLEAAIAQYQAAIRLRPAYADAHSNLANVLAMQGNVSDAIRHYLEAVRIDPDYAAAHSNLGAVLAGEGRLDEALVHYAAAVRLAPADVDALTGLAAVFAAQGRTADAIPYLAEALRLRPGDAELQRRLERARSMGGNELPARPARAGGPGG